MTRGIVWPILSGFGLAATLIGCQWNGIRAVAEEIIGWDQAPVRVAPDTRALSLTLYPDWGLVTDARTLQLQPQNQVVRFTGVPTQTDTKGGYLQIPADVTQARFRYDLLNRERLLERYNGQTVEIWPQDATSSLKATLIVTESGPVYRVGDRIYSDPPGKVAFPPLPGLVPEPALEWMVQAGAPYRGVATASYKVGRVGWQSAYTLTTDAAMTRGTLDHWASLNNQSGGDYRNAQITLVAGDVRREENFPMAGGDRAYSMAVPSVPAEAFAARYVYRPGQMTLLRGDDQRIRLDLLSVSIERIYRLENWAVTRWDSQIPQHARIRLSFKADRPLPRGKVTVYAPESGGRLAIAGEPSLPDTPRQQTITLDLGEAFDVTAERRQTTYRTTSESQLVGYRIVLRNQQAVPVRVELLENLQGDWTITSNSHPYTRVSASQVRFNPEIPARGEVVLTYEASIKRVPRSEL